MKIKENIMLKKLDHRLLPMWVRASWNIHDLNQGSQNTLFALIWNGMKRFHTEQPLVSIVIPAWNEEKTIARTLYSLSRIQTSYPTEIIVVNNNSTDRTQSILDACGVRSIMEVRQGVAHARQTGLLAAKGTYLLCGDADTLYPTTWVDTLMSELKKDDVVVAWGKHSFVPSEKNTRIGFAFYEAVKQTFYRFRDMKRPYLNAMGANVGYKRDVALRAGGYDTTAKVGEDGRLAMLMWKYGKIAGVRSQKATVWTDSRRFTFDNGLLHSLVRRAMKEVPRIAEYAGLTKRDITKLAGFPSHLNAIGQE
jgi:glycosyltransferase involved in cell wall biosynthesis